MIELSGRRRGGDLKALAYSPDGRSIATGWDEKSILVWDLATGRERLFFKLEPAPIFFTGLAWSPDGATILAPSWVGDYRHGIQVYDAQTGRRGQDAYGTAREGLAILDLMGQRPPDLEESQWLGRAEAIGWHLSEARASGVLCRGSDHLAGPTLSSFPLEASNKVIVLGQRKGLNEHLLVPQTAHGTWLGTHVPGMASSKCRFNFHPLAFSADGRTLAVTGEDAIQLRNTTDWQPFRNLPTIHGKGDPKNGWGEVRSFVFSPDGRMLVSGSDDGTVCLWSLAEPRDPLVFDWGLGAIVVVAFSPDGSTIAAGGKQKIVVWDVSEDLWT